MSRTAANNLSSMRELTRLQSLQVKLGQQLLNSQLEPTLRDDMEKLFQALEQNTHRLDELNEQGLALNLVVDHQQRHDIRNAIGIARGYAELIKETQTGLSATFANLLDKIVLWCNRGLAALERPAKSKSNGLGREQSAPTNKSPDYAGNVLILDDQQANRDLLSRYVEQLGLDSVACSTASQAFEALNETAIDLILLDLIMPDVSGHEVLAKLKASATWRAIPVIVISGLGDQDEVIRCIEAGADDYLQKPFNRVLLQARLRAGLDRKKWVDTERHLSNELEKSHRFIKNTFGRYLSSEIVSNLLDKPDGLDMGGQLQNVTILMADIRGFTTISEKLPPHQVVSLLNNYLGTMADTIMAHNGTVDEFIGDAILALFGAPVSGESDAENAIRCAIAMQQAMSEVNARNKELELPEIQMGIGIHAGEVVAGNIGSAKRAKYGVVGHAVNLTSRVEDQTQPGEILATDTTIAQSGLQLAIGRQLELQPKGVSETVSISEINAIKSD
jgi:class 3 adenylate cyclase/CheY-like chemotaxis protein